MESHPRKNGIAKARESLAKIFEHVLTDEGSLHTIMRAYRGNVTGPNLYSLHRLFDEQRRQLDYWLGQVVEQAKAIGIGGRTTIEEATQTVRISPGSSAGLPACTMIGDLLARHEQMAARL